MVWDICMIHGVFIPLLNDVTRTSILCGWSATGPICSKACFHKNRMMMGFIHNLHYHNMGTNSTFCPRKSLLELQIIFNLVLFQERKTDNGDLF